jgi:nucleotide-binding universal stress UspA family protein
MKRILALIDLDLKAKHILESAFRMAQENQTDLIIYHHLSKGEQLSIDSAGFAIAKDKSLSDTGKTLEATYSVSPTYRFGLGSFKKSILDLVDEEEVDLIIMGSNGKSNMKEMILGSHAAIVMDNVSSSVLVLKEEALNPEIKEVVFASGFNEMDKEVFQYFLNFMKLPKNAIIHLLMVDTYSFFNQPTALVEETFKDFIALARPYIAKEHFYHGISIEDGVSKFMNEEKPDLLVMSNKYSRMIRTALSGSKMVATLHENRYPFLNIDYRKETNP